MDNIYIVRLPQYGDTIIEVMFANTVNEGIGDHPVLGKMKELTDRNYDSNGSTFYISDDDTGEQGVTTIIGTSSKDIERVIVHECFHVVMQVTYALGIAPDIKNHEAHAYLMDYIYTEIMDRYKHYLKAIEGEK